MNKIYTGVILAIIVVVGIFLLNSSNKVEYVATIDDEITQLENELAELDLAVEAGTLTSAQATEAKVKILTRLDTINTSIATSERATLTTAQRKQLSEGLDRLKNILITYQATLTAVDDTAAEADVTAKLKSSHSGGSKNLNLIVAETIDNVQEVTEEVIVDYETDENLDTQIEEIVVEEEAAENAEDMTSTSTDETIDDTITDDSVGVDTEGETSLEMPIIDDSSVGEVLVEEETEVNQ